MVLMLLIVIAAVLYGCYALGCQSKERPPADLSVCPAPPVDEPLVQPADPPRPVLFAAKTQSKRRKAVRA